MKKLGLKLLLLSMLAQTLSCPAETNISLKSLCNPANITNYIAQVFAYFTVFFKNPIKTLKQQIKESKDKDSTIDKVSAVLNFAQNCSASAEAVDFKMSLYRTSIGFRQVKSKYQNLFEAISNSLCSYLDLAVPLVQANLNNEQYWVNLEKQLNTIPYIQYGSPNDKIRVISLFLERALSATKTMPNNLLETINEVNKTLAVIPSQDINNIINRRKKLSVPESYLQFLSQDLMRLIFEASLALDKNLRIAVQTLSKAQNFTTEKSIFIRNALYDYISERLLSNAPASSSTFDAKAILKHPGRTVLDEEKKAFQILIDAWKQTSSLPLKETIDHCLAENSVAIKELGSFFIETLFQQASLEHLQLLALTNDKNFMSCLFGEVLVNKQDFAENKTDPDSTKLDVQKIRAATSEKANQLRVAYARKIASIDETKIQSKIAELESRLEFLQSQYEVLSGKRNLLREKNANLNCIEAFLSSPSDIEMLIDTLLETSAGQESQEGAGGTTTQPLAVPAA